MRCTFTVLDMSLAFIIIVYVSQLVQYIPGQTHFAVVGSNMSLIYRRIYIENAMPMLIGLGWIIHAVTTK